MSILEILFVADFENLYDKWENMCKWLMVYGLCSSIQTSEMPLKMWKIGRSITNDTKISGKYTRISIRNQIKVILMRIINALVSNVYIKTKQTKNMSYHANLFGWHCESEGYFYPIARLYWESIKYTEISVYRLYW